MSQKISLTAIISLVLCSVPLLFCEEMHSQPTKDWRVDQTSTVQLTNYSKELPVFLFEGHFVGFVHFAVYKYFKNVKIPECGTLWIENSANT